MNAEDKTSKRAPCPICKRAGTLKYKPFCSKRCADLDLHRWMGGSYAVPGEHGAEGDEKDFDA